jgi:hypothetical protein
MTRARTAVPAVAVLIMLHLALHLALPPGAPWAVTAAEGVLPVAIAGASVSGSTASWRAVATAPDAAPAPSALTLVWTSSGGVASAHLDVVNTGSLALVSQRLEVRSLTDSGATGPDPVELAACVGAAWVASNGTCAGTVVALGSDRTSPLATGVPLAPGARLSVRATTRPRTAAQATTTVAVLVTRADARPPRTTAG